MNLKYYLRGLGIGIIVTAVVMGAASAGKKETISDAEVMARAAELGMVEAQPEGVLADLEQKAQDETDFFEEESEDETDFPEEVTKDKTEISEDGAEASGDESGVSEEELQTEETAEKPEEAEAIPEPGMDESGEEAAEESEEASSSEPEETPEPSETDLSESIIIEIKEGEGSYTVCRKLEDAGLIASASAFDAYLYENGYDRKLRIGTYEIPDGAEPETIAKILAFGR